MGLPETVIKKLLLSMFVKHGAIVATTAMSKEVNHRVDPETGKIEKKSR